MTEQIPVETLRPRLQMLSQEQILAIHNTSLDILSQTGIVMKNARARELLLEAGAVESGGRLKIPPHLVAEAIASAPSRIPLHNRLGQLTMPLEAGQVFFGTGSDCPFTIDVETGERRTPVLEDIRRLARLADSLGQIDFVMSMSVPSDVPPLDHYLHAFVAILQGSSKPIVYTARDRRDMQDIYCIASAVAGGEQALRDKPFLLLYAEPISPLLFNDESVEKLVFCAEHGIPAAFPPSPNAGGGGPIGLAGAIALANAENLAGLVITQLVRRGSPFLYGWNTAALDMKSAIVSYGSPEWNLGMAACADLGRYYNLPIWGYAGATDSKVVDAQAGVEATTSIMMAFLARSNLNHDVGYIEYGSTSSMAMMVLCDEIIREVRHMMSGVEVSERTLARQAIHAAQPGSGFLAEEHTLKNWKWAQWRPALIDRLRYDTWRERGSQDLATRAAARARELLAKHQPAPLSAEAQQAIQETLQRRAG